MAEKNTDSIPDSWAWASLEECVEILDRFRIPINSTERSERTEGKSEDELYPYYGATGQVGYIDDFIFDGEHLLIGEDGAPFFDAFNPVAYIATGKYWVNNHAHVLRAIEGLTSNRYLCHYINTFDFTGFVTGTTRLKLNQTNMKRMQIPLAPYDEQNRIVDEIEARFSQIEKWLEVMEKLRIELPRLRASILNAAVEGRLIAQDPDDEPAEELLKRIYDARRKKWEDDYLAVLEAKGKPAPKNDSWKEKYKEPSPPDIEDLPDLPVGWLWVTMPELGELGRGRSRHRPRNDPKLYGGDYPFIQTGDVRAANGLITQYSQTYNEVGLEQSKLWSAGTMCITIAANIADTGILGFDACFPDSVVGFVPEFDSCNVQFVEYYMRTIQDRLDSRAPATAQKNINLGILEQVAIPLPPRAEQDRIVDEVEAKLSIVDRLEDTIRVNLIRAEKMHQSILKNAFEGRLVDQDPNDEPASKLLERIKEERKRREEEEKKKPRKPRTTVSKNTAELSLVEILKEYGGSLSAYALFKYSKYSHSTIEDFYEELRQAVVEDKVIKEDERDDPFSEAILRLLYDEN